MTPMMDDHNKWVIKMSAKTALLAVGLLSAVWLLRILVHVWIA